MLQGIGSKGWIQRGHLHFPHSQGISFSCIVPKKSIEVPNIYISEVPRKVTYNPTITHKELHFKCNGPQRHQTQFNMV